MRTLAFTGLPGSGKSEAVALARERGVPVLRMGDLVFAETRRQGLPLDQAGKVADAARSEHGADVWAERTVEALSEEPHASAPLVIIDGVRSVSEADHFHERLGRSFRLVAVTAPDAVRHERLAARARDDATEDPAGRDEREKAWGIEAVIRAADVTLDNSGALEDLRARAGALLDEELESSQG